MRKRLFFTLFILMIAAIGTFGQKIKYKELFVLLSAKDYDNAEPYLKRYLKVTDDNPNAYLFMAFIYESKASKQDILKQTDLHVTFLDSAVYFFGMASNGMTEKEVSRNDEYYQMFNRRDVRTGEFGVKLSDVVLRIEEGMKLKERAKGIRTMKAQFLASEKAYRSAFGQFTSIQKQYHDQRRLFLHSNDSLIKQLNDLTITCDSSHMHFNDYKATAKGLGKIGYNQDFNPQDIVDIEKPISPADFYVDDIKIQDFKRWAVMTIDFIEKEVKPLRDKLVSRDRELNQLQQRVKNDSVSVRAEVLALRANGFPELKKIDPNPLPLGVFAMKEAELMFASQVVENKPLRDSAGISTQMDALKREISAARVLDSIAGGLVERNVEQEALDYQHFVKTAYGTPSLMKTLIRSTKELALREIIRREARLATRTAALRWIVDNTDSIPLFADVSAFSRFKPMVIQEEKLTAGLVFADSVGSGYFYTITPSRKVGVKAIYPVNKVAFKKRYLPVSKVITATDAQGMVFFVLTYQETKLNDKYQATLTKIYKVEGLAWSTDVTFDQIPVEMVFMMETSELSVKTKSSIGELFVINFDRDGKAVK